MRVRGHNRMSVTAGTLYAQLPWPNNAYAAVVLFATTAPVMLMDGVAAGSRRVGPFEHGRFGATISLDLALSGVGIGKGSDTHERAAYDAFHSERGFMANRVKRYGGPMKEIKKIVEKQLLENELLCFEVL